MARTIGIQDLGKIRHMIDGWFADYTPAYNAFMKALLLDEGHECLYEPDCIGCFQSF